MTDLTTLPIVAQLAIGMLCAMAGIVFAVVLLDWYSNSQGD